MLRHSIAHRIEDLRTASAMAEPPADLRTADVERLLQGSARANACGAVLRLIDSGARPDKVREYVRSTVALRSQCADWAEIGHERRRLRAQAAAWLEVLEAVEAA
jgi:hypothetical protein